LSPDSRAATTHSACSEIPFKARVCGFGIGPGDD